MSVDGELNPTQYTREQLVRALDRINRERYPQNLAILTRELASRPDAQAGPTEATLQLSMRDVGYRVAAIPLIAGGSVGAVLFALTIARSSNWGAASYLLAASFILAFVASGFAGVLLWRRTPGGVAFAALMFVLQIPVLEVDGFSYQYFTGMAANFLHGPGGNNLTLRFGASAALYFRGDPQRFILGVNLVAVVASALLVVLSRRSASPERLGNE